LQGLFSFLKGLGAARMAAMAAVTLALVGFFGFVIMRVTTPPMATLFTDLTYEDSSAIIKDLERQGIPYEMKNEGAVIQVPKDKITRLRMKLAEGGLPKGGGVGYEIFDKSDALGSTSFVQNINHLRALEGELSRTIRSIGRVQAARVHLVIPERRLFERDREPPRASIALKLAGDLDNAQVRAIRHLVSSAVDGLKPDRVSIVDERGRLLADGAQGEQGMIGVALDERQGAIERRIKAQVDDIVASIVGPGRARVQVSAVLDSNRIESRSETFDPESKVIRSSQNRTEASASNEQREGVTVGNELPGAQQNQGQQQGQQRDTSSKNEEVVNYEISRTTRTEVQEGGRVRKLSVAVLVDGVYSRQGAETTYQPRSQEELERIGQLVRTAIGFDRQRGDQVEVVNLRFAEAPQAPTDLTEQTLMQQLTSFTKEDIVRFAEMGVIALLVLIVLMVVVRPLLKQVLAPDREIRGIPSFMRNGAVIVDQGTGDPSTLPSSAGGAGAGGEPGQIDVDAPSERMLAIAQIKGQLKAQSVEKIGAMVAQNPADSVAVLRGWIHEKAPA
jgi:flagellar M-ring protein FliF